MCRPLLHFTAKLRVVFFFIFLFLTSQLCAAVLVNDTFTTNTDGWSGTNVTQESNQLRINRDNVASKTFSFPALANQTVTLSLNATKISTWESGDLFVIQANGSTIYNSNTTGAISLSTTLNGSGDLTVTLSPNTNNDAEDIYIDNFQLVYNGTPGVAINNMSIYEGANGSTRTMTFTVSIYPSASGTINYATSNVTATSGSDYGSASGTITFVEAEVTERTIDIPIYGDTNSSEGTETFNLTLSGASGFIITKAVGVGTIYDYGSTNFKSGERDFELRNPQATRNKTGDILVIGNTSQCVTDNGSTFGGTCTTNLSRTANNYYTKYLDIDSNTSTFNSSSATIAGIPTGAKVIWAGLYWQGFLHECGDGDTTTCRYRTPNYTSLSGDSVNLSASHYDTQKVYIDIPNNATSGYEQVIANQLDYRYVSVQAGGTVYSAFAEISELLNTSNANGTYTVANIQSMEGVKGYGNFAAWSLFVIYEDLGTTAILRNMSVYDGFKTISQATPSQTIELSGFLTPTKGTVDSKLISFAGEGEYAYSPDRISVGGGTNYVSNTENPNNNVFNSTIAGFARNPNWQNANGIDIDIFNVSSFMSNGQTSTSVTISTEVDAFYPSVVGFSTQLYAPDVCYLEDIFYNGQLVSGSNIPETGRDINITVSVTNKDNEPAQGVFIEKAFENPSQQLAYKTQSMSIQPIGSTTFSAKTDTLNDDTAEYASASLTAKFLLGTGASSSKGGTIQKDEITKFSYLATVGTDSNISENIYKVSYRNDYLKLNFQGVPIRKCQNFNNAFSAYTPVIGKFNTVRSGAINVNTETDPLDPLDVKNALYTQIVNQPFNVDVLSFGADNITPTAPTVITDLNLSIVELTADGNCTNNNLSNVQTLQFSTSDKSKPATVLPLQASQNAAFHMVTSTADLCSRDRFAIRPFSYKIDANETGLIGKRMYQFSFVANQFNAPTTPSINYNQTIDNALGRIATTQLSTPVGCGLAAPVETVSNPIPFGNGQASALVVYTNIGSVDFNITDSHWTLASQDQDKADCITNSASNTPDANSKIGCNIQGSQQFTFLPKSFQNSLQVQNFANNFTYISNDGNMSAQALLTTTALLEDNTTATNYTAGCFARNINYTISLINNPTTWLNGTPTAINRIRYFEDGITSNFENNNTIGASEFSSTEGNFTNGTASNLTMLFNLTRTANLPDEPFNISKNDFNITTIDVNGTIGVDFNRSIDQNTTFYYGRVYAPDYRGVSPIAASIYYEVYCNDCNRTTFNITGNQSPNSFMWYQNLLHTALGSGSVTLFSPLGTTTVNPTATNAINTGTEPNTLTNANAPYTDRIRMTPSPWLLYNPFNAGATTNDFNVEFQSPGNWAGQGDLGQTVDVNASSRTNRRIEW